MMHRPFERSSTAPFEASASIGSYVALGGIPFIVGGFSAFVQWEQPGSGAIAGTIALWSIVLIMIVWLRGFVLAVDDTHLRYRDGLYVWRRVPLRDVSGCAVKWISTGIVGGVTRVPRMVISIRGGQAEMVINQKPFARKDLKRLKQLLEGGSLEDRTEGERPRR